MKKMMAVLLTMALCLSLLACGKKAETAEATQIWDREAEAAAFLEVMANAQTMEEMDYVMHSSVSVENRERLLEEQKAWIEAAKIEHISIKKVSYVETYDQWDIFYCYREVDAYTDPESSEPVALGVCFVNLVIENGHYVYPGITQENQHIFSRYVACMECDAGMVGENACTECGGKGYFINE